MKLRKPTSWSYSTKLKKPISWSYSMKCKKSLLWSETYSTKLKNPIIWSYSMQPKKNTWGSYSIKIKKTHLVEYQGRNKKGHKGVKTGRNSVLRQTDGRMDTQTQHKCRCWAAPSQLKIPLVERIPFCGVNPQNQCHENTFSLTLSPELYIQCLILYSGFVGWLLLTP